MPAGVPVTQVRYGGTIHDFVLLRPDHNDTRSSGGDRTGRLWDGRGVANDGIAYENSYAWIMRLSHGEVVNGTAFYDSISFNDLWTRVEP